MLLTSVSSVAVAVNVTVYDTDDDADMETAGGCVSAAVIAPAVGDAAANVNDHVSEFPLHSPALLHAVTNHWYESPDNPDNAYVLDVNCVT